MTNRTRSSSWLRNTTVLLLGATGVLIAAASAVGISDNPPGIALLYGSSLTLVLAVAHRWRSPKKFGLLLMGAIIGFVVMVAVHNFAEVGAERVADIPVLPLLLTVISVIGFLTALFICPAAGIVGAVGWVATAASGSGRDA